MGPLSSSFLWLIILSWCSTAGDVLSYLSLGQVVQTVQLVCGASPRNYFQQCLDAQFVFMLCKPLVLLGVAGFAAEWVSLSHPNVARRAKPSMLQVVAACLRGFLNLDLAWTECVTRNRAMPDPRQRERLLSACASNGVTTAIVEVFFGGAQAVVCLQVLVVHLLMVRFVGPTEQQLDFKIQVVLLARAVLGLLTVSHAGLLVMRQHKLSAWALSKPPARQFLGLIDVSPTWGRSLLLWLTALSSVTHRVLFTVALLVMVSRSAYHAGRFAAWPVLVAWWLIASLQMLADGNNQAAPDKDGRVQQAIFFSVWVNVPVCSDLHDEPGLRPSSRIPPPRFGRTATGVTVLLGGMTLFLGWVGAYGVRPSACDTTFKLSEVASVYPKLWFAALVVAVTVDFAAVLFSLHRTPRQLEEHGDACSRGADTGTVVAYVGKYSWSWCRMCQELVGVFTPNLRGDIELAAVVPPAPVQQQQQQGDDGEPASPPTPPRAGSPTRRAQEE